MLITSRFVRRLAPRGMTGRSDSPTPLLVKVLRVLAEPGEGRLPSGTSVSDIELEWLLSHGLGPTVQSVAPPDGFDVGPRAQALLRGADLTSRALTAHMLEEVHDVVGRLKAAGVTPTILKGVSYATRYYPEPHLRVMGDVDLLVEEEDLSAAERILTDAGFEQPPSPWRPGHHVPPFRHESKELWLELHHALRPSVAPEAHEPPLGIPFSACERRRGSLGSVELAFLAPECELALISAGWCFDLKKRFGIAGAPRSLVDTVHLLSHAARGDFDWDKVVGWSRDTYTGACIGVVLTYLQRCGAYRGPAEVAKSVARSQPFVTGSALRAVHSLLDRYVVTRSVSRFWTESNIGTAFDTLIAPRPAWRNLLATPVNVAFPRGHARRFQPGFLFRRLRHAVSGRRQ